MPYHPRFTRTARALLAGSVALLFNIPAASASGATTRLPGHIPNIAFSSQTIGRVAAGAPVSLALVLPLRDSAGLQTLLHKQYDPSDPLYQKFITPADFAARFAPTQSDYDAVTAFAQSQGLQVTATHGNRLVLDVEGAASTVENAFGLHLYQMRRADGTTFVSPDNDPAVPTALAGKLSRVVGLQTATKRVPQYVVHLPGSQTTKGKSDGTGHYGGYTPTDIKTAYDLTGLPYNGSGQTLAVFELDGFNASDVETYEGYYHLPNVPLDVRKIDSFDGRPGAGEVEVVLDIDLQIALAPGAKKVIVYEGPNTDNGVVDLYNKIATDDEAQQISSSWASYEDNEVNDQGVVYYESLAFQEMAAQGQTMFAAAGDNGAYDPDTGVLSAQDPASQPYVCGVGGTTLFTDAHQNYVSETTWNEFESPYGNYGAGGGGISQFWDLPDYQKPFINKANKGSLTSRNVPDVSLNADPLTGYDIYNADQFGQYGGFVPVGGTSAAAPLWAGYTAIVNQFRAQAAVGPVGFINPSLYSIASNTVLYSYDFHDIADGSNNGDVKLYGGPGYPAVKGYDLATGLGTFDGAQLLLDLGTSPTSLAAALPPNRLLAFPGDGQVQLSWDQSLGATAYAIYRGPAANSASIVGTTRSTSFTDKRVVNGTGYAYEVAALNPRGTSAPSKLAFAQPGVVQIASAPVALVLSKTSADILWATNVLSDSSVSIHSTGNPVISTDHTLVISHRIHLTGLSPWTTYVTRVTSNDGVHTATSAFFTFSTPRN